MNTGYHLPDRIYASEYFKFGTEQFSKSRNNVISADEMIDRFGADIARFFLVISGPETGDTSFTWEDFRTKTNSELIGKVGNFVNRVAVLGNRYWPSGVGRNLNQAHLEPEVLSSVTEAY